MSRAKRRPDRAWILIHPRAPPEPALSTVRQQIQSRPAIFDAAARSERLQTSCGNRDRSFLICSVKSAPPEFATPTAISAGSASAPPPILPAEHPIGCDDRTDDADSALIHLFPTQIIAEELMNSTSRFHGGLKRPRSIWTAAAAPLATFALATGSTVDSVPQPRAAAPVIAQTDGSQQPVFTSESADLCVPAQPLVVQQDSSAQVGDAQISPTSQSQPSDAHSNILLASASDAGRSSSHGPDGGDRLFRHRRNVGRRNERGAFRDQRPGTGTSARNRGRNAGGRLLSRVGPHVDHGSHRRAEAGGRFGVVSSRGI
jgi:hypothetical protein